MVYLVYILFSFKPTQGTVSQYHHIADGLKYNLGKQLLLRCLLTLFLRNLTSAEESNSVIPHVLLRSLGDSLGDVELGDGLEWKGRFLHRSDAMAGGCWMAGLILDFCLECMQHGKLGS